MRQALPSRLGTRPSSLVLALLAVLTVGAASRAHGADDAPTFATLLAAYEAADKQSDVEARVALLPRLCRLAAEAVYDEKDDAARRRVREERKKARSLCRNAIVHPRRVLILAGLDGYGILALPGSSDDLKHHAGRQDSERRPHEVRLAAITAWGRIHDPGTHGVLIDHLRLPSRDPEAAERAVTAVEALHGYRAVPRGLKRFELLRDVLLLFSALRDASGVNTGVVVSADATQWHSLLERYLVVLVNVLADQAFSTYDQCIAWWREHRHEVRAGRR